MELRDYQNECLKKMDECSKTSKSQLIVLPTGSGKTVIFSHFIKQKNLRTLVIAHRIELLHQALDKLKKVWTDVDARVFDSKNKESHKGQVVVGSIQGCDNNMELLIEEKFDVLIVDEAHHAAAKSYQKLIHKLSFDNGDKWLVGFTATPYRADGKKLPFKTTIFELKIQDLIDQGHLVRPKGLHVKLGIDLTGIKKQNGDFELKGLRKTMLEKLSRDIVVNTIKEKAIDRHGIVFCVGVDHSDILAEDLRKAGFKAASCHSKLSNEERSEILTKFELGELQFVTNPMILTEGFDCPKADCMINSAPTMNKTLYIQKAGRVLRLYEGKKDALLIDFGKSSKKNSLCLSSILGKNVVQEMEVLSEGKCISMPHVKPFEDDLRVEEKIIYDPLKDDRPKLEKLLDPVTWKFQPFASKATKRQIDYIKKLGKRIDYHVPSRRILKKMTMKQASTVIEEMLDINNNLKPTAGQFKYLEYLKRTGKIGNGIDLNNLNKDEARSLIGKLVA